MRQEFQQLLTTVEQHPHSFFFPKRKKRELVELLRQQFINKLEQDLDQIEQRLLKLDEQLDSKVAENNQLTTENSTLNDEKRELGQKLDAQVAENNQLATENSTLNDEKRELGQKLDAQVVENTQLATENAKLSDEKHELALKQAIISALLSSRNQNIGVQQYYHFLNNDFLAFANNESSLKEEATALLKLQELGKELELISNYPDFHHKRTLAVAGGFSAGKSEFISSLFRDKTIKLPSGVRPTTAIPTYIMHDKQNRLLGVSSQGGVVDLRKIDNELHHKLSHHFINSFGFNLKNILPNLFLTTALSFEHLCFIDTPGYNAAASRGSFTAEDVQTAKDFTHQAEAVLWLIGLDANGTISETDCEFLSEMMAEQEKPLYIVLNKADSRTLSDVEDIIEAVAETLDEFGIRYAGISAYSSLLNKEFSYHTQPIMQFIKSLDKPSDKHIEMLHKLYEVDLMYQKAIWTDINEYRELAKAFKTLELDLYEEDVEEELYEKVGELKQRFDTQEMENHLKELEAVIKKLHTAIEQVFDKHISFERIKLNSKNYKEAVDLKTVIDKAAAQATESKLKETLTWYDPTIWGGKNKSWGGGNKSPKTVKKGKRK